MRKPAIYVVALFVIGVIGISGLTGVYGSRFSNSEERLETRELVEMRNYEKVRHGAIRIDIKQAIELGDYNGYLNAVGGLIESSRVLSEEEFNALLDRKNGEDWNCFGNKLEIQARIGHQRGSRTHRMASWK